MRTSILLLSLLVLATSGCSVFNSKKIDYKSSGTVKSLEVPPDLVLPSGQDRYKVPDINPKGSATYSEYDRERMGKPQAGAASDLLPTVEKASIERAGGQRWLVVQIPAKDVWPVIKDFWQETGFLINVEAPDTGVMETDWAENRAKIPEDGIRKLLGKAIDMLYSTAERDKFRTRVEPGKDGKTTEIYISHRGMIEVYEGTQSGADQGQGRTMWQPRPSDPDLEAEMLRRLMVRFGVEDARAKSMLAEKAIHQPHAVQVKDPNAAPGVTLPEPFDRAWRRIGLALDRVGFVVEDRDRASGIYFVRYADPEADAKAEKKGFLSKLAFWSSDEKKALTALKYQIRVKETEGATSAHVFQADGNAAKNDTGHRIATLLFEQLK
ncbi:MAG: outer membrane protein assembly factor BamC [Betaproteobacteria bacterium]|nr:outer membrane protein assembly factor BamC [Betaproteobacteria bacterium]